MGINNPIGERYDIKSSILGGIKLPDLQPGCAYVFTDGQTGFYNHEPGTTKALIRQKGYKAVYLVNISPYRIDFKVNCQCKNTLYNYDVEIKTKCKVNNPVIMLKNNVTDIKEYIEVMVQKWADGIVKQYDEIQYEDVKRNLDSNLDSLKFELDENGVTLENAVITLQMDSRVRDREVKRDQNEYAFADTVRNEKLKTLLDLAKLENKGSLDKAKVETKGDVIEKSRQVFNDSPDALLWMDAITGEDTAESVYTKSRELRYGDKFKELEYVAAIKGNELAEDFAIHQHVQEKLLDKKSGESTSISKDEPPPFSADDTNTED